MSKEKETSKKELNLKSLNTAIRHLEGSLVIANEANMPIDKEEMISEIKRLKVEKNKLEQELTLIKLKRIDKV